MRAPVAVELDPVRDDATGVLQAFELDSRVLQGEQRFDGTEVGIAVVSVMPELRVSLFSVLNYRAKRPISLTE